MYPFDFFLIKKNYIWNYLFYSSSLSVYVFIEFDNDFHDCQKTESKFVFQFAITNVNMDTSYPLYILSVAPVVAVDPSFSCDTNKS